jgi:hypothetical protein
MPYMELILGYSLLKQTLGHMAYDSFALGFCRIVEKNNKVFDGS